MQQFVTYIVALVGKVNSTIITFKDRRKGAASSHLTLFSLFRDQGQTRARPQGFPQMDMGMSDQSKLCGKSFLADITLPALDSFMGKLVFLQIPLFSKGPMAHITLVRCVELVCQFVGEESDI